MGLKENSSVENKKRKLHMYPYSVIIPQRKRGKTEHHLGERYTEFGEIE
jgi:hypothetical protein